MTDLNISDRFYDGRTGELITPEQLAESQRRVDAAEVFGVTSDGQS